VLHGVAIQVDPVLTTRSKRQPVAMGCVLRLQGRRRPRPVLQLQPLSERAGHRSGGGSAKAIPQRVAAAIARSSRGGPEEVQVGISGTVSEFLEEALHALVLVKTSNLPPT
jgi:hypothetical protein